MNRGQLVAGDQTVGLRARDGGVALHVGDDQIELGAAERLDAAGLVDHLDRELGGIDAALSDLRHASGDRIKRPDVHGIRRPASERDCAERGGGNCAARGLDEEVSAA